MRRGTATTAALLTLLAFAAEGPLAAHPFHVTLAEVEYNQETRRLEVALRVWPLDLERALELRLDRDVDLDRDPDIEERVAEYAFAVFRVRDEGGRLAVARWVGMELDLKDAWLYFEVPLPHGPSGVEISNRAFFELEENQVNTVNVRLSAATTSDEGKPRRVTLTLTPSQPTGSID